MVERVTISTPEASFEAPEENTAAETTERPEWLPEGFETPEAFAAAYAELKAGKAEETTTEEPEAEAQESTEETETESTDEGDKPTGDPVRDLLTSKGVDYDALNEQFAADGKLSDDNYTKLQEAGYPRELVDNYLEGERMRAEATTTRLYGIVGGEDQFKVMATWAGQGMDPKEVEQLNTAFQSGNAASAEMAMATLKLKYEAANGRAPKLMGGKGPGKAKTDVFESTAAVSAAINDPRYRKDPAYRKSVEEKIARSSVI